MCCVLHCGHRLQDSASDVLDDAISNLGSPTTYCSSVPCTTLKLQLDYIHAFSALFRINSINLRPAMLSRCLLCALCAVSSALSRSVLSVAQVPLLLDQESAEPRHMGVILAFTTSGSRGAGTVQFPLGERMSGVYRDVIPDCVF